MVTRHLQNSSVRLDFQPFENIKFINIVSSGARPRKDVMKKSLEIQR